MFANLKRLIWNPEGAKTLPPSLAPGAANDAAWYEMFKTRCRKSNYGLMVSTISCQADLHAFERGGILLENAKARAAFIEWCAARNALAAHRNDLAQLDARPRATEDIRAVLLDALAKARAKAVSGFIALLGEAASSTGSAFDARKFLAAEMHKLMSKAEGPAHIHNYDPVDRYRSPGELLAGMRRACAGQLADLALLACTPEDLEALEIPEKPGAISDAERALENAELALRIEEAEATIQRQEQASGRWYEVQAGHDVFRLDTFVASYVCLRFMNSHADSPCDHYGRKLDDADCLKGLESLGIVNASTGVGLFSPSDRPHDLQGSIWPHVAAPAEAPTVNVIRG